MERTQPGPEPEPAALLDIPTAHPQHGHSQATTDALVSTMLTEIADRLEENRPLQPITAIGRLALLQATTMDPCLAPALRAAAPEIPEDPGFVVRREYAAQLREIAGT